MGFYPVEVLINDAKRHGVAVLPVDVNRSRFRTTTEWVGHAREPLPEGAGIDRRPSRRALARLRRARASRPASGTRPRVGDAATASASGLHLVKGIGEAEGEALDAELARGGPYRSLADLVARTELPEEVVERLIRAGALDSLGRPRRELLWQLREVAAAARGRTTVASARRRRRAARSTCVCRRPRRPTCRRHRSSNGWATATRSSRSTRGARWSSCSGRRSIGWARSPAALAGRSTAGQVAIGGLVVTRQHPMTAKGTVFLALEDETGMVNVTLWPDAWARLRGVVRRHALLYVEGTLQSESKVINLVARRILPLAEVCRPLGGPSGRRASATWATRACAARAEAALTEQPCAVLPCAHRARRCAAPVPDPSPSPGLPSP